MGAEMKKTDWIILRLIRAAAEIDLAKATMDQDVRKAILHLHKKHGKKKFNKCIDLLNKE
jgi:hypothetical protein